MMTLEQAIQTALDYENKVCAVYEEAAARASDPTAKRMLEVLVAEERRHVEYLESRLAEWKKTGTVTVAALATDVPSAERIRQGVKTLKDRIKLPETQRREAIETLKRALQVEDETSKFYERVVGEMPDAEQRRLFQRFLEIERGHGAIVQAELDSVQGNGFWFDTREFELEGA
jgi:rubrerythrin